MDLSTFAFFTRRVSIYVDVVVHRRYEPPPNATLAHSTIWYNMPFRGSEAG
jgi:hypothetical protein